MTRSGRGEVRGAQAGRPACRSIRHLLTLVAIAAVVLTTGILAHRRRSLEEHARVIGRFRSRASLYEGGRLPPEALVDASAQVMEAEIQLGTGGESHSNSIAAHLDRVSAILHREIEGHDPRALHARPWLDAELIEEALERSGDRIGGCSGVESVRSAREECGRLITTLRCLR